MPSITSFNAAVRAGCLKYPKQIFGQYQDGGDGACVIGAARATLAMTVFTAIYPRFQWSITAQYQCPNCRKRDLTFSLVIHLNDFHRWSREAIAEYCDPHPEWHLSGGRVEVPAT